MQIHNLKPLHKNKKAKKIGRGGKKGTYSGKGQKGQKARAGRKIKPQIKEAFLRLPKWRGAKNTSVSRHKIEIRLDELSKIIPESTKITPEILKQYHFIPSLKTQFKIIASKKPINKKYVISSAIKVSKGAASEIEQAGGKIE